MTPRNKFILIGGLVGAALGAATAWAYLESQQNGLWAHKRIDGKEMLIEAGMGDFFRIGMAVFGLVKQVQAMAKRV